jgi:hypothetical protein
MEEEKCGNGSSGERWTDKDVIKKPGELIFVGEVQKWKNFNPTGRRQEERHEKRTYCFAAVEKPIA